MVSLLKILNLPDSRLFTFSSPQLVVHHALDRYWRSRYCAFIRLCRSKWRVLVSRGRLWPMEEETETRTDTFYAMAVMSSPTAFRTILRRVSASMNESTEVSV